MVSLCRILQFLTLKKCVDRLYFSTLPARFNSYDGNVFILLNSTFPVGSGRKSVGFNFAYKKKIENLRKILGTSEDFPKISENFPVNSWKFLKISVF